MTYHRMSHHISRFTLLRFTFLASRCPSPGGAVISALLLALAAWLSGCGQGGHAHDENEAGHGTLTAESRVRRNAAGEVVVTLDAAAQEHLALVLAPPAPARLPREVKAYGRVLDPAPLAALLTELLSATAALDAATKEWQRLKGLHEQGENAPKRAVEAAEAARQRDQLAADAAHLKLVTGWGQAVASQPDFPAFVKSLARQETLLVRLDLPAGETSAPPIGARLFALTAPDQSMAARFLGPAPDVDSQAQGQGFLFLVMADSGLRPGQALIGQIAQPGEPLSGLLVPPSAVVRAGGRAWVYVQDAATNFIRRAISLDHPADGGWLVTHGLTARDRLVITGAQMLFSEELKERMVLEH
jgi:hypothetical protein